MRSVGDARREPTSEELSTFRKILTAMVARTGSVTLHFKDGEIMRLEYRTFEGAGKAN